MTTARSEQDAETTEMDNYHHMFNDNTSCFSLIKSSGWEAKQYLHQHEEVRRRQGSDQGRKGEQINKEPERQAGKTHQATTNKHRGQETREENKEH